MTSLAPSPIQPYNPPAEAERGPANPRRTQLLGELGLVFGALCAAVALMAIFEAPTDFLYRVAVGVTEWGHLLALVSLAPLLLPAWWRTRPGLLGAALGLFAAVLALTPLLRATSVAQELPERLTGSFGEVPARSAPGAPSRASPLVLADIVRGVSSPPVSVTTLTYSTGGSAPLDLDLYRRIPGDGESVPPAPCVIVVHGGSWRGGDKTHNKELSTYLAARGYVVASVDYHLAPESPFPDAYEDVIDAVVYLSDNAPRLGIDPEQFVLLGRSAGGQLALLTAYTFENAGIRGVVSFYGPSDLGYAYQHPANPAVLDTRSVLKDYLGGTPDAVPYQYVAASPLNEVNPAVPPTLLIHGGRDEVVSPAQSRLLAERLAEVGRPYLFLELPWATHACDFNFSGQCGQISTYAVERFLAAVTR